MSYAHCDRGYIRIYQSQKSKRKACGDSFRVLISWIKVCIRLEIV